MKNLACIIVDDDTVDRMTVISFAKRFPYLTIKGSFASIAEAVPICESESIDILFLDIDMPDGSGLDFRKQVKDIPVCIFITAYPEHAAESFDLDTLDFIVKPVKFDRFSQAMNRVIEYLEIKTKALLYDANIGGDTIYIKEGLLQSKVKLHEVLYLEALKDYTLVVTPQKRHCVLSNIGTLLKEPHFASFIRVHRSFAVQKHFIEGVTSHGVLLANQVSIPIGRSYKQNLNAAL